MTTFKLAPLNNVDMFNNASKIMDNFISRRESMLPLLIEKRSAATVKIAIAELQELKFINSIIPKLKYYDFLSNVEEAINKAIETEANYLMIQIAINDNGDFSKSNHIMINISK